MAGATVSISRSDRCRLCWKQPAMLVRLSLSRVRWRCTARLNSASVPSVWRHGPVVAVHLLQARLPGVPGRVAAGAGSPKAVLRPDLAAAAGWRGRSGLRRQGWSWQQAERIAPRRGGGLHGWGGQDSWRAGRCQPGRSPSAGRQQGPPHWWREARPGRLGGAAGGAVDAARASAGAAVMRGRQHRRGAVPASRFAVARFQPAASVPASCRAPPPCSAPRVNPRTGCTCARAASARRRSCRPATRAPTSALR